MPVLRMAGEVADLVEVADVSGDGDVGRIAVVEEVFEADLHRDGTDELAEARHLEIFHVPDLQHQGAEGLADKGHFAVVEIDGVKVRALERGAERVFGRREGVDEMEDVGKVSPDDFFFEGGKAEGCADTLLRGASMVVRLKIMSGELLAKPAQTVGLEIEAEELDGVGVGKVEVGIGVEAGDPCGPVLMIEVSKQRGEVGDGNVGVIFDGLPEVLGGIIGGAVEWDAFGDGVPVGKIGRASCRERV